ncbi:MAG: serine/threonine protein kinase [Bdellovibrionales bacterium]|nr:serine/threonine protein kinase [Bdellovibrionales bacterium]
MRSELQIGELIAEGGMGEVYQAVLVGEDGFRKSVAAKRLKAGYVVDRSVLLREARIQAQLSHPNICAIFDVREASGEIYLIAELLEGHTLRHLIRQMAASEQTFSNRSILYLIQQVSNALDYAHAKGVVHRDLSPSNVFLTKFQEIKLIDFGLARDDHKDRNSVFTKGIVGSLEYLSPERVDGLISVPASDFFALGVIALEMATLESPFKGNSDFEIMSAVKKCSYNIPALDGEYGEEVLKIIDGLLQKEPENRFGKTDIDRITGSLNLSWESEYGDRGVNPTCFNTRKIVRPISPGLGTRLKTIVLSVCCVSLVLFISRFIFGMIETSKFPRIEIDNGTSTVPVEKHFQNHKEVTQIGVGVDVCYYFYREILSMPTLLYSKHGRDLFLYGDVKRSVKQAASEIVSEGRIRENLKKQMGEFCKDIVVNKSIIEFHDNMLMKLEGLASSGTGEADLFGNGLSDSYVESKYLEVFVEPYPGFFMEETRLRNLFYTNRSVSGDSRAYIAFEMNSNEKEIDVNDCLQLGHLHWISTYFSGRFTASSASDVATFIIFRTGEFKDGGGHDEKILLKSNPKAIGPESWVCIYVRNGFKGSSARFYQGI